MQAQREAMLEALAKVPSEDLYRYSTGATRNYGAFIGYDFTPRLGELTMPACIIHGNADTTVPFEYARTLHAGIPHAEFHEIDGAMHGLLAYPQAQEALTAWVRTVTETG